MGPKWTQHGSRNTSARPPGKITKNKQICRSGGFGGRQPPVVGATAASRAGCARGGPPFQAARRSSGASRGFWGHCQKVRPIFLIQRPYLNSKGPPLGLLAGHTVDLAQIAYMFYSRACACKHGTLIEIELENSYTAAANCPMPDGTRVQDVSAARLGALMNCVFIMATSPM